MSFTQIEWPLWVKREQETSECGSGGISQQDGAHGLGYAQE